MIPQVQKPVVPANRLIVMVIKMSVVVKVQRPVIMYSRIWAGYHGRTETADHGRTETADHCRTVTADHCRTETGDNGRTESGDHSRTDTSDEGRTETSDEGMTEPGDHSRTETGDDSRTEVTEPCNCVNNKHNIMDMHDIDDNHKKTVLPNTPVQKSIMSTRRFRTLCFTTEGF